MRVYTSQCLYRPILLQSVTATMMFAAVPYLCRAVSLLFFLNKYISTDLSPLAYPAVSLFIGP